MPPHPHLKKSIIFAVSIIVVFATLIAIAGFLRFNFTNGGDVVVPEETQNIKNDPLNISYKISGDTFTLVDGSAEKEIVAGSSSKNTLSVFGEPVKGDLDNDGDEDQALWLVNNAGGSGTFYYGVLAINNGGVYKSTNTMLLGDRIAPQTLEIRDGRAIYNYAERKAGEPYTTQPSVGRSVYVHLDPNSGEIGEWVKDFEGEVDTNKMSLTSKSWTWISAKDASGKTITPKMSGKFVLTFKTDGTFGSSTDCNGVGGNYKTNGSSLTLGQMMSTLMFCEGSQESPYTSMLSNVATYSFGKKGELIMTLKDGKSTMVFK